MPSEEGWLECYPVSRRVNSVRNDGPDLVERIPDSAVAGSGSPTPDPETPRDRRAPGLFDEPDGD